MQSTLAPLAYLRPIAMGLQPLSKVEKRRFPSLRRKVTFWRFPDAFCAQISMQVAESMSRACKARWHHWLIYAQLPWASSPYESRKTSISFTEAKSHVLAFP